MAGLPPATQAPPTVSRTDRIRRYVEQYDGGECFFVAPVAVGEQRVTIEGFGASLQPFHGLDEAFQRDIGFSADIGVRQVTSPQCPAITLLGRLRDERARAPRLDLDKVALRSGETLSGTVERFGSRHVELLLVTDRGTVQNVSNLLKPGIDAKTFSIGLQQRPDATGSLPQLLVAVASPRPLQILQSGQPTGADQLFPALLNEATRSGQTLGVTARYFKLDR
jgi:serine/threonine-protein kinase